MRRLWASLWLLLCVALCNGCGQPARTSSGPNLIGGKAPSAVTGVNSPLRLTDGVAATNGDHWETDITSVLFGAGAYVEYDLGTPVIVDALYLQGDNNDEFLVSGADDSRDFRLLWKAERVRDPGMQDRSVRDLGETVRYLRVTARGGDNAISLSEVQAFTETPEPWPPSIPKVTGKSVGAQAQKWLMIFAWLAGLLLLAASKQWPLPLKAGAVAATVAAGGYTLYVLFQHFPVRQEEINLVRVVAAAVSVVAVARLAWKPGTAWRPLITGNLAAMAALAVAAFYNLGAPQFNNVEEHGHTYVHTWDMRVYFPTAKYFDELGFDGLYLASVAAYAEDVPGSLPHRIANTELRDLRNYHMTRVREVLPEIESIKDRFTPERWEEFRNDMAFFRKTMGPGGYLGSLRDHGGNATPAWLLVAHAMFRNATATETNLLLAAALDPALLLLFFIAAWRTFGVRAALVCLVIYGTTTFPMFGSNWAGSTLRNDWMVLLGLGACALKARRWALGGAILAGAAMARAFPAFAVFALPLPALWWLHGEWKASGKLPGWKRIREAQRPLLRATVAATACVAVLTLSSGAVLGFQHSWGEWFHKIGMHSTKPNVNHVGLRTVMAYSSDTTLAALSQTGGNWSVEQVRTYKRRLPLFIVIASLYTALAVAACRRQELYRAALVGLMLIPIWLYPSNYYLHYCFVLGLLADPREGPRSLRLWGLICCSLLLMSVAQYFGWSTDGTDERYAEWSWSALVGYAVILVALAKVALGIGEAQASADGDDAADPADMAAGASEGEVAAEATQDPPESAKAPADTGGNGGEEPSAGRTSRIAIPAT